MKLSINIPNPLNQRAKIYLDGVLQEYVTYADEENGVIQRYRPGYLKRQETPEFEIVHGKVKIIDPLAVDLAEVYLK